MNTVYPKITDNLALNFLNTRIVRHGKMLELIQTPEDLLNWFFEETEGKESLVQADCLRAYLQSIKDVHEIINFRDYLYQTINRTLKEEQPVLQLQKWLENQLINYDFEIRFWENRKVLVPKRQGIEGLEALIYLHLSDLIENDELQKLSHCSNPKCVLLFVNKTGKRKWCSMKICGNRNKVKRFSKKTK